MATGTMRLMSRDQLASTEADLPEKDVPRSGSDIAEKPGPEAHAGSEPMAEQSIPATPGHDSGGILQRGALASLLLKNPAKPIEVVRALDELGAIIGESVRRELVPFRMEVKAWMDVQGAKFDALRRELDALRKVMRLMVAMFAITLTLLGALVVLGLMNLLSTRIASTPTPQLEVQAPLVSVEEAASASSDPALGASPVGGDDPPPTEEMAGED